MPISRILYLSNLRSLSFIYSAYPLPTYKSTLSEQLFSFRNRNIRDIAAHKVYPILLLPIKSVGSYPTFSPFPTYNKVQIGSYFLRHFLSSAFAKVHSLNGVILYAVRTFLYSIEQRQSGITRQSQSNQILKTIIKAVSVNY